jgi:hypothetical protein
MTVACVTAGLLTMAVAIPKATTTASDDKKTRRLAAIGFWDMHKAEFLRTTQVDGITSAANVEEAVSSRRTRTTEAGSVIVPILLF